MKLLRIIRNAWRDIFRKRRFNMLNATDNSEEWHMHLSPASIFAGLMAFVLLLFILVLSLVAYTPVLEFLPGYRTEAGRSREMLMQNILRIDSMERVVDDMMTYNENIALVMEGKTPVARTYSSSDSTRTSKILVMPSREDSLLRAQMEGEGIYSLANSKPPRRKIGESILISPIDGIITERFDIKRRHFGIRIAAAAGEPVTAIDDGTVVINRWTPEAGHILEIQHTNNLLSIYRHLSQPLVVKGDRIRSGDLIGYSAEVQEGKVEAFEFELWNNGKPVDPEGYILF
ncbi:MAG: M23 family metallopeptidase [Alistipes sp.]|nr:M23 family metallopeptidase [Alistipes senegalensis]MCM1251164.1 M23 family metallopeptidase [Alistipes sp.]